MTNITNSRSHSLARSDSAHREPPRRSVRRVLAAVRRGWDDATYLNGRLFEGPQ